MATVLGKSALATVDLIVSQGADMLYQFRYLQADGITPVSLVGWTARAQMRDIAGGAVWATWTTSTGITLDSFGMVVLNISHTTTEATPWNAYKKGVWDLELTDTSGNIVRLAEGKVLVSHDVTRTP